MSNTLTIKLDDKKINKLKEKFIDNQIISKNPYVTFFAKKDDTTISIYTTNKVVIQSKYELSDLKKLLSINTDKEENNNTTCQSNHIYNSFETQKISGSDEVGCGDVFGPVVACCVSIQSDQELSLITKLPIKDSKKLSDSQIVYIAKFVIKNNICDFGISIIENQYYNHLTSKYNLNEIKMLAHLNAYKSLKTEPKMWIIDEFASKNNLYKYQQHLLSDEQIEKPLNFASTTKAESKYYAVALASILARYYFLEQMNLLSKKVGEVLLLGASNKVTVQYTKIKDRIEPTKFAKLNFKNISNL